MFNTFNLFCNFARNIFDQQIRSSCFSAAKTHFEQLRTGFTFGKNLYISPENRHLKDCNIYQVQTLTGALYHGARDSQTVLDLANQHGAFPPGKGLHVVDAPDVSAARMIAGPNGVMVLVENKHGVASDAYGNMQIPLHLPKKIVGIWEKDAGRASVDWALYASIRRFIHDMSSRSHRHY
jgi:hypothetical protein